LCSWWCNSRYDWIDAVINIILDVRLPTITDGAENHFDGTFEIQLLEDILPTFDFVKVKGREELSVIVSYAIKFEVCLAGLPVDNWNWFMETWKWSYNYPDR